MFDLDDPTKTAEDKMSDAMVLGCIGIALAAILIAFLFATLVKVWF